MRIHQLSIIFLVLGSSLALPSPSSSGDSILFEFPTCEDQLARYRKFMLQAILSMEDICDSVQPSEDSFDFLRGFRQNPERNGVWSFIRILMAQFDDLDFTGIIRQAVLEKCQQHRYKVHENEKRDAVVLGKKQRFHSWGGK